MELSLLYVQQRTQIPKFLGVRMRELSVTVRLSSRIIELDTWQENWETVPR